MEDIRVKLGFFTHPKTIKANRRTGGKEGGWAFLRLIAFCAGEPSRCEGDLSGMTDEDIEIAAGWDGEQGSLVKVLSEVGFLEGEENARRIHDLPDHNPWMAGFKKRHEQAVSAAEARWRPSPDQDECGQHAGRNAVSMRSACGPDADGNTPTPSLSNSLPTPCPSDSQPCLSDSQPKPNPSLFQETDPEMEAALRAAAEFFPGASESVIRKLVAECTVTDVARDIRDAHDWSQKQPNREIKNPNAFLRKWIRKADGRPEGQARVVPPADRDPPAPSSSSFDLEANEAILAKQRKRLGMD